MRPLAWLFLLACTNAPAPREPAPPRSPELNKLMNEQVNPTFSKLTFLAFHADTLDDPDAAQAQLVAAADRLSAATERLSTWPEPPVQSDEGREVFQAYSNSMKQYTGNLVTAARGGDPSATTRALEKIAETCNNCHHFFRLHIKDSVVGPATP